jgi:glutaconate CoA-transferase subunit B
MSAPSRPFTIDEWLCATLARTVRDGETTFHGFASPCATIAMHLARRTHAPRMVLVEGSTYAIDPEPPFIPPTSNDWSLMRRASHVLRFEELFDLGARGGLDRMFLSGVQIDARGNTNVTAIGGLERPKVKVGGGGGGCNLSATVGALTLWSTRHRSGRALVERCDVVTDLGHNPELGLPGGGPEWLVTELGVFDFPDGRARLWQRYPDVSVEEVRAATGFAFEVADERATVPPPDPAALALIRAIDPLRVREREFAGEELRRRFAWSGDAGCTVCM